MSNQVTFQLRNGQPVGQHKSGTFQRLEQKAITAATDLITTVEDRVADTLALDGSDIDENSRKGSVSLEQHLVRSRSLLPENDARHRRVGTTELQKSSRANPSIPGGLGMVSEFSSRGEGFHQEVGYHRQGDVETFEQYLLPDSSPTMTVTRNLRTGTLTVEDFMGGTLPGEG